MADLFMITEEPNLEKSNGSPQHLNTINNTNEKYSEVDVYLLYAPKDEKELIPNMKVLMTDDNHIDLADLVKNLKIKGFPVEKSMISYFSFELDLFMYCGTEPLPNRTILPSRDILKHEGKAQITLRIRQSTLPFNFLGDNLLELEGNIKMEAENESQELNGGGGGSGGNNNNNGNNSKQKRTKERKIGEILNKVCLWRKLYNGYTDPVTNETIKMSLEDAAQRVGISKKSLDDYLLQIRFGKKFGFNFNDHANDRVGILRAHVKKYKSKQASDKHKEDIYSSSKLSPELSKMIDKKSSIRKFQDSLETKYLPPPISTVSSRTRRIYK